MVALFLPVCRQRLIQQQHVWCLRLTKERRQPTTSIIALPSDDRVHRQNPIANIRYRLSLSLLLWILLTTSI